MTVKFPTLFVLDVRPEVAAFAKLMEQVLRNNDHKRGWKDCSTGYLTRRMGNELEELREVVHRLTRTPNGHPTRHLDEAVRVGLESADVAAFAMMLTDVCGGLPSVEGDLVVYADLESKLLRRAG